MSVHSITTRELSLSDIEKIIEENSTIELSDQVITLINKCRIYLDNKIKATDEPIYGINTGFGSLYKEHISKEELVKLQENIIQSHACGAGDVIPDHIVKLILLLKVQSLSYGHSGVQIATVQRLVDMFNQNIIPTIFEYGSLGASGDLAPLAHLSLPLIGLGEVSFKGHKMTGSQLLEQLKWSPIGLKAKEGLALLNGTQFMSAYGVWNVIQAKKLVKLANLIGAVSVDAFDGRIEPFLPEVHRIRPQAGQAIVAREVHNYLQGSQLIAQSKRHVQDPYSFRCIPQVHGATYDTICYVESIFVKEINGVTDNPNVFPDEDKIISAGNFHGQPLALAHDFMTIALAELGSISERRTYQLISGNRELPNYLIANPGINSGMMIPQYTAASIVSQNKIFCHPASVDSIVSSNGQEDHVSMGANAATKGNKVLTNIYTVLAIELITAAQALDLRKPLKSSPDLEKFINNFREIVPFIEYDRVLHNDIISATEYLKDYKF